MEIIIIGLVILLVAVAIATWSAGTEESKVDAGRQYYYERKAAVMTPREAKFFRRLEVIAKDKYYVFPQIHLSALMLNKTTGRYRRLAFQRINRTSVDYVLCDKETMTAVYAVELDDKTHDTSSRRKRDAGVEAMLASVSIPLIRFRGVERMTDDQMVERFKEAAASRQ